AVGRRARAAPRRPLTSLSRASDPSGARERVHRRSARVAARGRPGPRVCQDGRMAGSKRRGSGGLDDYEAKRDFGKTSEPPPGRPADGGDGDAPGFVVQAHSARRLHWDLRLERDGVLASWALPRGVPDDPKENRLAVRTEDHPL